MKQQVDLETVRQRELRDVTDELFWELAPKVLDHTLLAPVKLYSLYESIRYIADRDIPGDIVECGVYHGGAMMLAGEVFYHLGKIGRKIYLYDTFCGFVRPPTEFDISSRGNVVGANQFPNVRKKVEALLQSSNYPFELFVLVEGDVVETIQTVQPNPISMLRLDTDTYDTTQAELEVLYPHLSQGGVLVIDDYGHSQGARKAVDEYFSAPESRLFLQRTNWTCRTAIKS